MKFDYGNSWEKFPIKEKETWSNGQSSVSCGYVQDALPPVFLKVIGRRDVMIYTDPPWNINLANSFHTKNGDGRKILDFKEFYKHLFKQIALLDVGTTYLEIGAQHLDDFKESLSKIYPYIEYFNITYYRKKPCFLLRGSWHQLPTSEYIFNKKDDVETPYIAMAYEKHISAKGYVSAPAYVIDLCMGRGCTAVSAIKSGINFIGLEMNKRRLACTIEKASKLGVILSHMK